MIGRRSHDDAQSFDDACNGRAPRDQHIADLVRLAEGLCEAAVVEPSMQFRTSLREQLMTEAATVLVPAPPVPRRIAAPQREPRPAGRRVATLTAAVVASAGVVGIVASSASAVPGEMLYGVKRTVEKVELQLHRDDVSRGSFELAQASERLAEARRLSADGASSDLVVESLEDFSASATDGSAKLFTAYTDTGEETSIRQVNEFAAASSVDLSVLSGELPEGADDSLADATEAITNLASEASSLCTACLPADMQALVSSVTELGKPTAKSTPATSEVVAPKSAAKPDKQAAPTQAPAAAPPATQSPATTPAPAVPVNTPSLTNLTDPLLGGLLGNDKQPGLIPGLLGGLLGGAN